MPNSNIFKKYILLLRFITDFIITYATDNRARLQLAKNRHHDHNIVKYYEVGIFCAK